MEQNEELEEEIPSGLDPVDYLEKTEILKILDVRSEKKISNKTKKEYTQYFLDVEYVDEPHEKTSVNYLFSRDLRNLKDQHGSKLQEWIGKEIEITAFKDGEYFRWDIKIASVKEEAV